MKKIICFLTLVLTLSMAAQAQLIAAIKKAVPHFVHGVVTFTDGHEQAYTWIDLPKHGTTKLKVSDDPKHKKTTDVPAAEVSYITVWSDKLPEKKMVLYYIHADKSKFPLCATMATDAWGYPIAGNNWGMVYKCNASYSVDKKSGEILCMYDLRSYQNMIVEIPAPCYLVCPDYENAQYIGGSASGSSEVGWAALPKRMSAFFHDYPAIEKGILDKKLTGRDIQYILDEMALSHGVQTEGGKQTSTGEMNGTVGDDE